jgi:hypothetical protein
MQNPSAQTAYCTILAINYLPKALALAASLKRHHDLPLTVVLIDCEDASELPTLAQRPELAGVQLVGTDFLGLSLAEVRRLAGSYHLVEFATAIKPLVLQRLLETHEQAAYLDPDTYVTSPMEELPVDLAGSRGGILLTPHFLRPPGADAFLSEGHLLGHGVFNLGFIAVDRRAAEFLVWWWDRLRTECLMDVLSGLFVDQKWMDLGSVYFHARSWDHPGYNVSIVNLHERPLDVEAGDGFVLGDERAPLRLFHFHAFDPDHPEQLSTRFDATDGFRKDSKALDELCRTYAEEVVELRAAVGAAPPYRYSVDSRGRAMTRQLRRAYRLASLEEGASVPSPFDPAQAAEFDVWRRHANKLIAKETAGDLAKATRAAWPEPLWWFQSHFPRLAARSREKLVRPSGLWGG